ncbi:hypothetical protein OG762_39345 [Streptomyces sp. NBC_01136]|uniref:DUF6603 domain-containing protein n=1 Tax=Streptomyces sp. NBC_01136 TaxID=2903754 RepID=UPI0038664B4E|nr:hypothetical protein OG762_39345 [Streptomyces sp. NBC_01136]
MTLTPDELRAAVTVTDRRLDLDLAGLLSGGTAVFLGRFLSQGRLVLRDAVRTETANGVDVSGTGDAAPFTGITVTATLTAQDTGVVAVLDAEPGADWSFADSFPALDGTFFDGQRFENPRLHIDTAAIAAAEAAEPGNGSASFTGTLVVGTRLALLDVLFPGADHALTGTVRMTAGLPGKDITTSTVPDIAIDGPGGGRADLGLFSVEQLRYAIYGTPHFNYYLVDFDVPSYLQVIGAIPFTTGSGPHTVVLAMEVAGDGSRIRLRADFRDVGPISLADVAALTGPARLAVPFDFDITSPVVLTDLVLLLTPGASELVDTVGVVLQTQEQWPLVPGVVTLEEIDVAFTVSRPLSARRQLTGSVRGLVAVGQYGTLEIGAVFETRTLSGRLRDGDPPLHMREIFGQFIGGAADHIPDIAVSDFYFSLTLPDTAAGQQLAYEGRIELDADWTISDELVLTEVAFLLDHQESGTAVSALTKFSAGGIPITVTADYDPAPAKGWTFAGETGSGIAIPIGGIAADLARTYAGLALPAPLAGLTVSNLGVRFTTGTKALFVTAEVTLPVDRSTELDLTVTIDTAERRYSGDFTVTVDGTAYAFTVRFADSPDAQRFVATYRHGTGPAPTLKRLVGALSPSAAQYIPDGVTVDLKDALFAFDKAGLTGVYVLGADLAVTVDLANLPLVGERFAGGGGTFGVDPLRLLAVSGPLAAAEAAGLNTLLPAEVAPLPAAADLAAGFTADAVLKLGEITQPLSLPAPGTGQPQTLAAAPGQPKATDDNVVWYKVQRTFGPVTFQRIGFAYQRPPGGSAKLAFLLDASLNVAGLALTLDGLAIGIDLADPARGPQFELRGLGVSYSSGEVEISGAFLTDTIAYQGRELPAYSGKAVLRTKTFSLGALGSYVQLPEGPSLFVYAFLDYPIGGPPVFFVQGLAAGFGYNRRFIAPDVAAVATFPLVAEAAGTQAPGALADELRALQDYLPPSPGDFFLAIGVHFSSFRMIDSVLLLSVGFGHRFEVDLLGLSTLVLPSPDAVKAGATPLAQVQLALRATFVPDEGYFALRAQLTENSYLLSRDCRLTGGFAFQVWFGEDHNGDFVLSVGGYHPRFTVPAHYPAVPRLGFTWQVTPQLTMKGSAYFALTPSALMAGGSFGATWQDGSLKAWFNASMDFLIGWSPYHYQADFWASIGASYTFSFFGTHTVSAQVGAQVSLWGPEFSGRAAIDIGICSFTLAFGAGDPAGPQPIDWTAFRKAFLPTADDAMVTVVLQGGAAGTGGAPAKGDLGSVNPLELVLSTDSVIPSHDAYRGPEQGGQALDTTGAATAFGIAPLGRGHNHPVAASQRIEIRRADGSRADDGFRYQPVTKNLPAAMWGDRLLPAVTDPALVDDLLTGYTIRPLPPAEPATAPYLPRDVLRAATALDTQQNAYRWLDRQPFVPDGRDAATRRQVIADSVTAPDTAAVRSAVAAAVLTGATGDDPLDLGGFDADGFLVVPQVGVEQ